MNAAQIVEAVLFASDAPLKAEEIARADESLDEDRVEEAIRFLRTEYDEAERAFHVVELAEGYQVLTRPEFAGYLERFDTVPRSTRLSGPALETLAIIAYRQPIGRIEIEYIRGVSSSGVIRTLQDRALVEVVGREEGIGRPLLYGTTSRFLEHFGFRSLEDLPRPEELPVVLRERVSLDPKGDEDGAEEGTAAEAARAGGEDAAEPEEEKGVAEVLAAADRDDLSEGGGEAPEPPPLEEEASAGGPGPDADPAPGHEPGLGEDPAPGHDPGPAEVSGSADEPAPGGEGEEPGRERPVGAPEDGDER